MEILITDVTEMHGTNYCVAGWDAANRRKVRPLPGGGHWPQALIAKHGIQPGTLLKAIAMGAATGAFPHLTEDTPIDPASIGTTQSSPDWVGTTAPEVSPSISEAFSNSLKWNKVFGGVHQGVYVPTGTQCSSLAAVKVGKANIPSLNHLVSLSQFSMMAQQDISSPYLAISTRRDGGMVVLQKQPPCFQIGLDFM
jgi:hypothetical protein